MDVSRTCWGIKMNDEKFFEICFDQYRYEQNQADAIYQRMGILLTALPILGAIAYQLGRPDLIPIWSTQIYIFLYLTAGTIAFVAIAVGVAFMLLGVCPRTKYKSLRPMQSWEDWRNDYRKTLGSKDKPANEETIGEASLKEMKKKVLEAEKSYSRMNEKRRKYFQHAVFSTGIATAGVALEAFFHMLLYLQGI
jgi:hypothetical protein